MAIPRYIYITDNSSDNVFTSIDDPTPDDFEQVEVGILTIIRLSDLCYYSRSKKWLPIPAGSLVTPEIDDAPARLFHAFEPGSDEDANHERGGG